MWIPVSQRHKYKKKKKHCFWFLKTEMNFLLELLFHCSRNLISFHLRTLPISSGVVFEFQRTYREPSLQGEGRSIKPSISLRQADVSRCPLPHPVFSWWSPKISLYSYSPIRLLHVIPALHKGDWQRPGDPHLLRGSLQPSVLWDPAASPRSTRKTRPRCPAVSAPTN